MIWRLKGLDGRFAFVHNARIWTGDPSRPWGNSIAVVNGRIAALDYGAGANHRARCVIDAAGQVVTPGLIDSHMHLLNGGKTLSRLDLSKVRSREEFEALIAAAHGR